MRSPKRLPSKPRLAAIQLSIVANSTKTLPKPATGKPLGSGRGINTDNKYMDNV